MWKSWNTLLYFYFHHTLSPSASQQSQANEATGATSGPPHRPVCQSYSQGFECAVTGANLRRPTITASPSRRSEATFAAAFTDAKHLKLSDCLGITMVSVHLWKFWNVSRTFFAFDLWVLGGSDNLLMLGQISLCACLCDIYLRCHMIYAWSFWYASNLYSGTVQYNSGTCTYFHLEDSRSNSN